MFKDLWARLTGRHDAAAEKRLAEERQMSPEERRFVQEGVEDHASDEQTQAFLGGSDPDRLIEE